MKWAYYNEIDPNAAEWLRQLIKMGQITDGEVDERSIEDVKPADVAGFQRVHWFAGIGGWELALRLADWPEDRPVWTGSCPCQPFSAAGKGAGFDDERHLWPAMFWLISQCRPGIIFGEQTSGIDGYRWWDLVASDLEAQNYACAAVDLPAAGVAAPHIRNRLYWLAYTDQQELEIISQQHARAECQTAERSCKADKLGYANSQQHNRIRQSGQGWRGESTDSGNDGQTGKLGDTDSTGTGRNPGELRQKEGESDRQGCANGSIHNGAINAGSANPWGNPLWLPCKGDVSRPAKPSTFPLVARLPAGVGHGGDRSAPSAEDVENTAEARSMRIKGYGNSIVPQLAAEFVRAACQSLIG